MWSILNAEAVESRTVLSLYGMLKCELCCELLLLLNIAHMVVLHVHGRLLSEQC